LTFGRIFANAVKSRSPKSFPAQLKIRKLVFCAKAVTFIPPIQPVHPANSKAAQIQEISRQQKQDQETFRTYHDAGKALRRQLVAIVPDVYI
jgi:hypothetical protein